MPYHVVRLKDTPQVYDVVYCYTTDKEEGVKYFIDENDAWIEAGKIRKVDAMAKAHAKALEMNPIQKLILKAKLKIPHAVSLNKKESDVVIDGWKQQSQANLNTQSAMITVSKSTALHIARVNDTILETSKTLDKAKKDYEKAETEEKKDIIARRIVLAGETLNQLTTSQDRLKDTVERVAETVEDARLAKTILDSRIEEAKIYRELNGGLKLVGESLSAAKQEHVVAKVEHENFETAMTALDSNITNKSREDLRKQAEKYINA